MCVQGESLGTMPVFCIVLSHTECVCVPSCLIILPPVASAPSGLMAVQEGPTSIQVSWSPPTPLGDTNGYMIYYSGGSSGSRSEDFTGGSTNSKTLTNLQNGESYTILSIVATSEHLPSESIPADMVVMLGKDMYK